MMATKTFNTDDSDDEYHEIINHLKGIIDHHRIELLDFITDDQNRLIITIILK